MAELLRVKALLFSLQNERLGITARISSTENDLGILLRDSSAAQRTYDPRLDLEALDAARPDSLRLSEVLAVAKTNRSDLRRSEAAVRREEANLSYQKALAIPDITVGGLWSRAGGYIPDYYALTLSVDLPLFNRNQGNIEVSEHTLGADRANLENSRRRIEQEVRGAYQRVVEVDRLYRARDRHFPEEYRSLVAGMIANYEKRYISVIEFTDFLESYRTNMIQMNQLENDRVDAMEKLNYAAGTLFFTP
jgi:cobalt-zinc-cadmium efflux system outer membrane protein